jgi:hypothetical protein
MNMRFGNTEALGAVPIGAGAMSVSEAAAHAGKPRITAVAAILR